MHGSCGLAKTLQEAGTGRRIPADGLPGTGRTGKRLFSDAAAASGLTLVDSSVTGAGVVYSAFTPAPFSVGRVGVEDGREVESV